MPPNHWTLAERVSHYSSPQPDGCWIWTGFKLAVGYGRLSYKGKHIRAHRASWMVHRGEIPDGIDVLHKCDVKTCVNPDHLYLGTDVENAADAVARNRLRSARGEKNGNSRLTADDVIAIRAATGNQRDIAQRFGVAQGVVWSIIHRKTWRHIP